MTVKNRVAIVTGATRGLGKAIAEKLASEGANIVCVARNQEQCDEIAKYLGNTYKTNCIGIKADVSSLEEAQNLIEKTVETMGGIDILVNNAGITRDNLLLRLKEEDWDQVIDINLKSIFNMTKAAIRPMLKKRYGRIINMSSVVGLIGNQGQANYAASKAGMIGFSKSIAKEFGAKGITCNAIAPGFIETDMVETLPEDYINNIIQDIPLKRLGRAEEIAHAVSFIASDEAGYITGEVLAVDGGVQL